MEEKENFEIYQKTCFKAKNVKTIIKNCQEYQIGQFYVWLILNRLFMEMF